MKIDKIYFDIDGVLADFERGVMEICGMMPPSQNDKGSKADKDNEMWEKIKEVPHFYDRLELMPGAKEMFDAVYGKYGDRCEILTGIPKPKRGITDILIDDMESNIRDWNEYGGTGIKNVSADETMRRLKELGII